LNLKNLSEKKARVLYFAGCTAALDPALRNIPIATTSLLRTAGVDFGILGPEEICCGSTALRIGERKIFSELAGRNVELINSLGVETIITSCAGCFRTLKHDYPDLAELKPEVLHSSEFLSRLFATGKLSFREKLTETVTYHDPCHLGRLGGVFDPPRELINRIPGANFRELDSHRENAYCCGAGGGVRTAFPDWATDNVALRIEAAEKTGAGLLVSTCPFCYQNFLGGIENRGSSIKFTDLVELLDRLIEK
jgi:heterodisulfide reductase subunit D